MSRVLFFFLLLVINLAHAEVLIDDTNPSNNTLDMNVNALLKVRSNDKAMLLPR